VNNAETPLIHTVSKTGSAKNVKRMKMFKKPNYIEQFTKVNERLTDLHNAYRILLQNVNKLQKAVEDSNPYDYNIKQIIEDVDELENDYESLETTVFKMVGENYRETDERLNKLEAKILGEDKTETKSENPFEEYLTAKEQFVAAKMDLLWANVWSMEWSVRTINCLEKNKIETLKDLCSYSEKSLLKTKNLGQKTLNEIKSVLAQYDLKLREENEQSIQD
jgi:DNA-directed RNA polymerase alpha subunit